MHRELAIRHRDLVPVRMALVLALMLMAVLIGAGLGPLVFPFDRGGDQVRITSSPTPSPLPSVGDVGELRAIAQPTPAAARAPRRGAAVPLLLSGPARSSERTTASGSLLLGGSALPEEMPAAPSCPRMAVDARHGPSDARCVLFDAVAVARGSDRSGRGHGETRTALWITMPSSIGSTSPP
jgi:hypothetical protein